MDKKRYILDLNDQKNFDKQLGSVIRNILYSFVLRVRPSVYDCHKDLLPQYKRYNRTIHYKNVHRRVQKLYSHNLIQKVKIKQNEKPKHKVVRYRLTSLGLFYMYCYDISNSKELIINYSQNELFKIFLYPYIELKTIESLDDNSLLHEINNFLTKCCQNINDPYLKSLQEIKETGGLVHIVGSISTLKDPSYTEAEFLGSKDFIQYLKNKFKINWLNVDTTTIQEVKKNQIMKIIEGKKELLLKIVPGNLEAILYDGNKVLFTFVLEKLGKKDYLLTEGKRSNNEENYIERNEFDLELKVKRNVSELCLWILEHNAELPYSIEMITGRLYTNKVLKKDKTFNKTVNNFKAEIDHYYEEFMNKK